MFNAPVARRKVLNGVEVASRLVVVVIRRWPVVGGLYLAGYSWLLFSTFNRPALPPLPSRALIPLSQSSRPQLRQPGSVASATVHRNSNVVSVTWSVPVSGQVLTADGVPLGAYCLKQTCTATAPDRMRQLEVQWQEPSRSQPVRKTFYF